MLFLCHLSGRCYQPCHSSAGFKEGPALWRERDDVARPDLYSALILSSLHQPLHPEAHPGRQHLTIRQPMEAAAEHRVAHQRRQSWVGKTAMSLQYDCAVRPLLPPPAQAVHKERILIESDAPRRVA